MAVSDSIGLLFKISADSDQARSEIAKLRRSFDDDIKAIEGGGKGAFLRIGEAAGLSTGQMAGLAKALPLVAGGIAVVAGAAVAAGAALFALTKSASDYGSAIFDASRKTGLSTEAISALKFAADQSGASMEQLTAGIKIFSKTVGDAANGSKEAAEKLKRLGIDPQEAIKDLEGALAKAFKTINAAPEGILRTNAALDAFGRSGAELIPTIESFDGDLNQLQRTVGDLGGLMSEESAKMADDFGDAFDKITAQMKFAGFTAAQELMPMMTQAMAEISKYVSENKESFRQWGEGVGQIISGIRAIAESEIGQMIGWFVKLSYAMSLPLRVLGKMHQDFTSNPEIGPVHIADADANVPSAPPGFRDWSKRGGGGGGGGGGGRRGGGGRAKAAGQTPEERGLKLAEQLEAQFDRLTPKTELARVALLLLTKEYIGLSDATRNLIFTNAANIDQKKHLEEIAKRTAKAEALVTTLVKDQIAELNALKGIVPTAMDAVDELIKSVEALGGPFVLPANEALLRLRALAIDGAAAVTTLADALAELGSAGLPGGPEGGLFGAPVDPNNPAGALEPPPEAQSKWQQLFETIVSGTGASQSALSTFGAMAQDALGGMVQGVGSLIQNWVLMGNTAPGAMKKMVASVLAGLAAQAAMYALFELAKGFAALFFNPAEAAAHFKAAALFGVVAVGAAVGGRALAGNSFQQGAGAGASGGGASGGTSSGTTQGRETNIIDRERERNQIDVRIHVESNDSHIVNVIGNDFRNNGLVRGLMVQTAEG